MVGDEVRLKTMQDASAGSRVTQVILKQPNLSLGNASSVQVKPKAASSETGFGINMIIKPSSGEKLLMKPKSSVQQSGSATVIPVKMPHINISSSNITSTTILKSGAQGKKFVAEVSPKSVTVMGSDSSRSTPLLHTAVPIKSQVFIQKAGSGSAAKISNKISTSNLVPVTLSKGKLKNSKGVISVNTMKSSSSFSGASPGRNLTPEVVKIVGQKPPSLVLHSSANVTNIKGSKKPTTINIVTGKTGCKTNCPSSQSVNGVPKALPKAINLKIANGQIQTGLMKPAGTTPVVIDTITLEGPDSSGNESISENSQDEPVSDILQQAFNAASSGITDLTPEDPVPVFKPVSSTCSSKCIPFGDPSFGAGNMFTVNQTKSESQTLSASCHSRHIDGDTNFESLLYDFNSSSAAEASSLHEGVKAATFFKGLKDSDESKPPVGIKLTTKCNVTSAIPEANASVVRPSVLNPSSNLQEIISDLIVNSYEGSVVGTENENAVPCINPLSNETAVIVSGAEQQITKPLFAKSENLEGYSSAVKHDQNELPERTVKSTSSHIHHSRKHSYKPGAKEVGMQDPSSNTFSKRKELDDICCCQNCGCYGLTSEFIKGNQFCSTSCMEEFTSRDLEWGKNHDEKLFFQTSKKKPKCEDETVIAKDGDHSGESSKLSQGKEPQIKTENKDSLISKPSGLHPWLDSKHQFSWVKYLECCGRNKGLSKAAPLKLWQEPFPITKNFFRPNMKLEGIDPENQSLYCALTVVGTKGIRINLHFDGYSAQHNFWANADSKDIFPVGWCERNGKKLLTPPGYSGFTWKRYLTYCQAISAPKHCFNVCNAKSSSCVVPTTFQVGMKFEAEDRKNDWICVATISDIRDSRILVHFDGWDKSYDNWVEIDSPYIHQVGWCGENDIYLFPPKNYPKPGKFNWKDYLQETNSTPVPLRCFKPRPPKEFKKNMKLEVVDRRCPVLIRVATVTDVDKYRIKIHFDGWDDKYDYWVDDDSPDIHPPSWCVKTGHPLESPLTHEQIVKNDNDGIGCGTPGCAGVGHIKGPLYETHQTLTGCPYSSQNLAKDKDAVIPDRLQTPLDKRKSRSGIIDLSVKVKDESDFPSKRVRKRRKFFDEITSPVSLKTRACKTEEDRLCASDLSDSFSMTISQLNSESKYSDISSVDDMSGVLDRNSCEESNLITRSWMAEESQNIDSLVHQSVFNPGYEPNPDVRPRSGWDRLSYLRQILGDITRYEVEQLSPQGVCSLIDKIPGCANVTSLVADHQIDGESLLMMTQHDLVSVLGIKIGPAVKLMALILALKNL